MSTKIYGASDDLLEFEGDVYGEIGRYGTSEEDPIRVRVSDGTEFDAFYNDDGLWKIKVTKRGTHFDFYTEAVDPDSQYSSDELHLKDGDLTADYLVDGEWEEVS